MLDITQLKLKLKERRSKPMEELSKFAVLIPLIKTQKGWEVIYEFRAMNMKTQPGEISFPGGRVEEGESFREAAVRETMEELNLKEDKIEVIGELDYLITYANMEIHCFLGLISGVNVDMIRPNPAEVDHLFTVPLDFILSREPEAYELELKTIYNGEFPYNLIPNGRDYKFRRAKRIIYFYHYEDYVIWGYTATMTKHLADFIKGL